MLQFNKTPKCLNATQKAGKTLLDKNYTYGNWVIVATAFLIRLCAHCWWLDNTSTKFEKEMALSYKKNDPTSKCLYSAAVHW